MSIKLTTNPTSDGVTAEGTTSTVVDQTVTFHEDETVVVKEFPRYVSIGNSFKDTTLTAREMDIKNFLGRPFICGTGTYTTSSVVGSQLATIPLPGACLSNASFADKIRGFYGFRAKMVCRVQLNAQRFQQGRLLLHYLPQTSTMLPQRLATALATLVTITQQPRVDFELGKDTEVRLEIPYISNTMYYDNAANKYDFGTFYLSVYAALRTGDGSVSCPYTVWCHFEDVEVEYPTVSQSGIKTLRARGKGSSKIDVSDRELQAEGLGPISSFLTRASSSASVLSEIPLISTFTAPASWVLGVVGRAADALGYSKPTSAGPSEKRLLTTFAGMNQSNVIDNSTKMAIRSDNAVSHLPGFAGTDIDEMSIAYLISIPSWFSTNTWVTSQPTGNLVFTNSLGLTSFDYHTTAVSGGTTYDFYYVPVMHYVANNFKLWRGSITLTLKVVKTEFHSGRILIAFFPARGGIAPLKNTMANAQYTYREVLDLRTSSEVSITFPWTSLTPYMRFGEVFGTVTAWVLNPLVATSNVTQNVDILCEVAGAPDMEFAQPGNLANRPIMYTPQSGIVFTPQSGISATSKPIVSVFDNSSVDPAMEPSIYCIGERVQSIRQLIKRFSTYLKPTAALFSTIQLSPQLNYMPYVGVSDGWIHDTNARIDTLSYYAPLFRFWRGSTRVKVIDPSSTSPLFTQMDINITGANAALLTSFVAAPDNDSDHVTVTVPALSGGAEYELPYYSFTHASHVVTKPRIDSNFGSASEAIDNQTQLFVSQLNNFSANTRVYRAAGDDYSLGFFIGTLPLTTM